MSDFEDSLGEPSGRKAVADLSSGKDPFEEFRRIYETYGPAVNSLLIRRGFSNEEDRKELTQEIFLRVFKSMNAYKDEGKLAAWIYRIADNVAKSEWGRRHTGKRDGIEVPYEENPEPNDGDGGARGSWPGSAPALSASPDQEDRIREKEFWQKLIALVKQLPRRQRQCLLLWLLGNKYSEIATLLGISAETVKKHLQAAFRSLPDGLDPDDFDFMRS